MLGTITTGDEVTINCNTALLPSNTMFRFTTEGKSLHFENVLLKIDNRGFDCRNKKLTGIFILC